MIERHHEKCEDAPGKCEDAPGKCEDAPRKCDCGNCMSNEVCASGLCENISVKCEDAPGKCEDALILKMKTLIFN